MPHFERHNLLQGVLYVAFLSCAALLIGQMPLFSETLRLSPLIIGVLMGMIYANTLRSSFPTEWESGLKFCAKRVLRLAIVFYAFRLSITNFVEAGWAAFLIDVTIVTVTALLGIGLGRLLKLDGQTSLLVASGSAICGAAAVLGTESVIKAKPERTVVAVATVVLFGTLSMFLYPLVYSTGILELTPHQMAIYTGSTVHEVAHVAGAGGAMGPEIAATATITKMLRVVLLAPFLLIVGLFTGRSKSEAGGAKQRIPIPWFAIWFLALIFVNTLFTQVAQSWGIGDAYASITHAIKQIDDFALTMAMVALGMDATFAKFKAAGVKPFLLALALFIWLTLGGYFLVRLFVA